MSLNKEDKEWVEAAIVTIVAESLKPLYKRLIAIDTKLDEHETRLSIDDARFGGIESQIDGFSISERSLRNFGTSFDNVNERIDDIVRKINSLG